MCSLNIVEDCCFRTFEVNRFYSFSVCLQDELKVLFPRIRISDKQMRLNDEDIDFFITHAFTNVLYYQKELKKLEVRSSIK
jgi:hypothetical protein